MMKNTRSSKFHYTQVTLTKLVASDEGFDGKGTRCLAHFKIDTQEKAKFFKIEIPTELAWLWGEHLGETFKFTLGPEKGD